MKVTLISPHKFDAITEWMLRQGIPITLRNWLKLAYWRCVRLSDLGPEEIAEIPSYYLPRKYQWDLPKRRAQVVPIR